MLFSGNSPGVRMFAWGPDRFRKQPDHQVSDDSCWGCWGCEWATYYDVSHVVGVNVGSAAEVMK